MSLPKLRIGNIVHWNGNPWGGKVISNGYDLNGGLGFYCIIKAPLQPVRRGGRPLWLIFEDGTVSPSLGDSEPLMSLRVNGIPYPLVIEGELETYTFEGEGELKFLLETL